MTRILSLLVRLICYSALCWIVAAIAVLAFLRITNLCPELNEGGISCAAPFLVHIAGFAMMVVVLSAFAGLPFLLAAAGVVFLVFDIIRLRQKSARRES